MGSVQDAYSSISLSSLAPVGVFLRFLEVPGVQLEELREFSSHARSLFGAYPSLDSLRVDL